MSVEEEGDWRISSVGKVNGAEQREARKQQEKNPGQGLEKVTAE
jgi:hypothetical protein